MSIFLKKQCFTLKKLFSIRWKFPRNWESLKRSLSKGDVKQIIDPGSLKVINAHFFKVQLSSYYDTIQLYNIFMYNYF